MRDIRCRLYVHEGKLLCFVQIQMIPRYLRPATSFSQMLGDLRSGSKTVKIHLIYLRDIVFKSPLSERGRRNKVGFGGMADAESISLEETNRIRIELGLAPLKPVSEETQTIDEAGNIIITADEEERKAVENLKALRTEQAKAAEEAALRQRLKRCYLILCC